MKDGRACMVEGQFNTLGTIDEYWQGRSIIGSNLMPEFTWKELEYWGRTQYREHFLGQIHHDFGKVLLRICLTGMITIILMLFQWKM